MDRFEEARWLALMEAVNIIADECEDRGKSFDELKISPLDVEKYIESTCDIFARKIEEEDNKIAHNINIRALVENLEQVDTREEV